MMRPDRLPPLSLGPLPDQEWLIINDSVMGGVSASRAEVRAGILVFSGRLSLRNNGGFASTRTSVPRLPRHAARIRFRARGDGRRYQIRLRPGRRFDGVAYRQEFAAGPDWERFEFSLASFQPVFRGRRVTEAPPLAAREIGQLGFMVADRTEGPFRLEVCDIEALQTSEGSS